MGFRVVRPGTLSLLVDQGQPHRRAVGMPLGGPADAAAFTLGQALVGNTAEAVALEMTCLGPDLEATERHGCVVMGAPFLIKLRGDVIPVGTTFTVEPGDLLQMASTGQGCRAYLCVRGGWSQPPKFSPAGGWQPIQKGDILECPSSRIQRRWVPDLPLLPVDLDRLRVVTGSHLSADQRSRLAASKLRVRPDSNRMGLRLTIDPPLPPFEGGELTSAPVAPGTLQLPASGQPILLGVDAQTIGGYPRLAHVITADWPKMGQLAPGQEVHFTWVNHHDAREALVQQQTWLKERVQSMLDSLF